MQSRHAGGAAQSRAAHEMQKHRFRLVLGVMRQRNHVVGTTCSRQQTIALPPCRLFQTNPGMQRAHVSCNGLDDKREADCRGKRAGCFSIFS